MTNAGTIVGITYAAVVIIVVDILINGLYGVYLH